MIFVRILRVASTSQFQGALTETPSLAGYKQFSQRRSYLWFLGKAVLQTCVNLLELEIERDYSQMASGPPPVLDNSSSPPGSRLRERLQDDAHPPESSGLVQVPLLEGGDGAYPGWPAGDLLVFPPGSDNISSMLARRPL